MRLTDDSAIAELLTQTRRIAVVGASPNPERASNRVLHFLIAQGYDVVAVNPGHAGGTIHGAPVVSSLSEAKEHWGELDMVDIFRNSEDAGGVVDEAIHLGAKSVWLQLGVINEPAADRAGAAGLSVVMDRCPKIEIPRLGLRLGLSK
jgi:uncharacterized protein